MREFRYTPLANCFELVEIFEGVSATGDHTFYSSTIATSVPTSTPPTESISRGQSTSDSQLSDTASLTYLPMVSNIPIPKGRNKQLVLSLTDKMSAALDIILQPEPESEPRGSTNTGTIVTNAMRKLQEENQNKDGWTIEDLMLAYEKFENPVKAEIFLTIISLEEQELRLRRQLDQFQSTV